MEGIQSFYIEYDIYFTSDRILDIFQMTSKIQKNPVS